MKTLFKAAMIILVVIWLVPGAQAQSRGTVYVVCRKFVAERNCYKCSDYFHTRSEDEAQTKCSSKGYDKPNYFRSFRAMSRWMLGNCTCDNDE